MSPVRCYFFLLFSNNTLDPVSKSNQEGGFTKPLPYLFDAGRCGSYLAVATEYDGGKEEPHAHDSFMLATVFERERLRLTANPLDHI